MRMNREELGVENFLNDKKPMIAFSQDASVDEDLFPRCNELCVATDAGLISRFDQVFQFEEIYARYTVFTKIEEEWRAQAYFFLKKFMYERTWCDHLEWIEAKLLGYSDKDIADYFREKKSISK